MENLVFVVSILGFFAFVFIQGKILERKKSKWLRERMRLLYGEKPTKEMKIERFDKVPGYYLHHKKEGQIDDITWHDLSMDEVYHRLDYTYSSIGEEYLYYMLRTPDNDLAKIEDVHTVCDYFEKNEKERLELQYLFHKLGNTGKYSLYEYIAYLGNLEKVSLAGEIVIDALFAVFGAMMFVWFEAGLVLFLGLLFWQLFSYFRQKNKIEPYITSVVYILRMLDAAKELEEMKLPICGCHLDKIKKCRRKLDKGSSLHFLFLYPGGKTGSGNPLDVIFDYIRMMLHLDIIVFHYTVKQMQSKEKDIDDLITELGFFEASVSVMMYRASLKEVWCKPVFSKECTLSVTEVYHPLLERPVVNSIVAKRGVLLTGSNASGKSTFLKAVALSAVFAQAIGLVCAKAYSAPAFLMFSSMSLSDNVSLGDSYYMAEIKSMKRIMDATDRNKTPILVFVDEVLRGTNTVERIAASTQILRYFAKESLICFAATHDVELTHLLEDVYDNYHFREEIVGDDITFSYLLQQGRATTRNAIKLLSIMGYEESVIESAGKIAEDFLRTGKWKSSLTEEKC